MSKEFVLEATDSSPLCEIDTHERNILLSGVSMPENANEFYFPILEEVNNLFDNTTGDFSLTVDLSYMNSMSNKQLLRLMKHIESKGFALTVNWKYQANDDLMKAKGEELKRICPSINYIIQEI